MFVCYISLFTTSGGYSEFSSMPVDSCIPRKVNDTECPTASVYKYDNPTAGIVAAPEACVARTPLEYK